ncbi:unnamed protein product (macronuclear) [Paramecium tetraurelia]|uniref:B box-type domain-containing protein n=1 Tax=Paramecium tetraurelia TaxID=5888 RepID=A0D1L2_PARTE|nr:uncharacterized protein GSPATT00012453001 [Paramecium tetraurelia]CAK76929.1 unnamed protein product [Paramecium tetraurelia]|eukprot:XP_001444326.1 hypothetical protein (macronuclear) [Paramecium tetraurelia strain d4-2]
MQKVQIAYNYCQKESHTEEWLNTICIDQNCQQERLLCCLCLELHEGHRVTALKKFLIEYKQQYQKKKRDEEEMNDKYWLVVYLFIFSLSKILESFEKEVIQVKQIIDGNFDNLLSQIKESISNFNCLETCQTYDKIGKILDKISTSEQAIDDVKQLFSSIETITSKDGFQFQIVQPRPKLSNLQERHFSSQQIFNDYVEFNKQICLNFEKTINKLSKQIKGFFSEIQNNDDSDSLGQISTSISNWKEDHTQILTQNCQNGIQYQPKQNDQTE